MQSAAPHAVAAKRTAKPQIRKTEPKKLTGLMRTPHFLPPNDNIQFLRSFFSKQSFSKSELSSDGDGLTLCDMSRSTA